MRATRPTRIRAKFYGDTQERLTAASSDLLFFTLELNRIDDAVMEAAMAQPPLGHYRPWIEDLRRDKPYQLEDRIEQLFHEKSMTRAGAPGTGCSTRPWPSLRFEDPGGGPLDARADPEQAAGCRWCGLRREAAQALGEVFKANLRVFSLVTNTLAKDKEISDRWRGFEDVGDSAVTSPTASSARSWKRWSTAVQSMPIRACRIATTD